jgi:hypothetical protein
VTKADEISARIHAAKAKPQERTLQHRRTIRTNLDHLIPSLPIPGPKHLGSLRPRALTRHQRGPGTVVAAVRVAAVVAEMAFADEGDKVFPAGATC